MIARVFRFLRSVLGWPLLLMLAAGCGALLAHRDEAHRDHDSPPPAARNIRPRLLRLLLAWLALLVLLGVEFGISFLAMGPPVRPAILVPAALMVATVGLMFMQIDQGPTVVRLFAAAGLLWLTILLGLGSVDPLTRTNYHVPTELGGATSRM